jgi:hypothetical protein
MSKKLILLCLLLFGYQTITPVTNWNGNAINQHVTDDNITISHANSLQSNINITAENQDITITMAANGSIEGNNNTLTFCMLNNHTITIVVDAHTLTFNNMNVLAQPHLNMVFNGGTVTLNDTSWIWK